MASIVIDEELAQRLPMPLARLYRLAFNADSPQDRHLRAFHVWEAAIKLIGASAVVEYANGQKKDDPDVRNALRDLDRPSLGQWWDFSFVLVPRLAEAGEPAFRHLNDALFGKPRSDLPALVALDAALRSLFEGRIAAPGNVRI
jgi:hypothetical protein